MRRLNRLFDSIIGLFCSTVWWVPNYLLVFLWNEGHCPGKYLLMLSTVCSALVVVGWAAPRFEKVCMLFSFPHSLSRVTLKSWCQGWFREALHHFEIPSLIKLPFKFCLTALENHHRCCGLDGLAVKSCLSPLAFNTYREMLCWSCTPVSGADLYWDLSHIKVLKSILPSLRVNRVMMIIVLKWGQLSESVWIPTRLCSIVPVFGRAALAQALRVVSILAMETALLGSHLRFIPLNNRLVDTLLQEIHTAILLK